MSALIDTAIVAKFGRERTAHDYRVAVVGNDTVGYRAQPETRCGRVFDDTTKTMSGVVTCDDCTTTAGS